MRATQPATHLLLSLVTAISLLAAPPADAVAVRQTLTRSGADPDAVGKVKLNVRKSRTGLRGLLKVTASRLAAATTYEVTIDGVLVGAISTNRKGKGRLRLRSNAATADAFLGVDPRGRSMTVNDPTGATVLIGRVSSSSLDPGDVRCCVPDDSGVECEDRTAAECVQEGGIDLGPGSCLPNPCEGSTPAPADVTCCLPGDSGAECEDRTAAQCAAQGGVVLQATGCTPNPCLPITAPSGDARCCLQDDSGPKCEDRTAAECAAAGGTNIGVGACLPNPCFPDGPPPPPGSQTGIARVTCERRADRSRVSVDGQNLASGSYEARITSGGASVSSTPKSTVGDEAEFDFDSEPDDIAAGATAIAAGFLQGTPPTVLGEILDGSQAVVASATAVCATR